jgi:peptide deformylase
MIITDENELRKPCAEVSIFEAQGIVKALETELDNSPLQGIGLAANQIGIFKKVCILRVGNKALDLANPIIVEGYDLSEFEREGCLSFPEAFIITQRYAEVVVKDLFHENGVVLTGLMAVVAQHEIGHLSGNTMYDFQIKRPNRNDPCWCHEGIKNGTKYKKCHMNKIMK